MTDSENSLMVYHQPDHVDYLWQVEPKGQGNMHWNPAGQKNPLQQGYASFVDMKYPGLQAKEGVPWQASDAGILLLSCVLVPY